jgi:hypothetical protein
MRKIVCAFFCAEVRHERADAMAKSPNCPRGGFAQMPFEFGEGHPDLIEVGRVLRPATQFGAGGFDRFFYARDHVGLEMVHHDDIAAVACGDQALLNIGQNGFSVHRFNSVDGVMTAHSFAMRLGLTNRVVTASTIRSSAVRFGAQGRERLLIRSWCFSASDSAATARMPPGRRSFAKVTTKWMARMKRLRIAQTLLCSFVRARLHS